MGGGRNVGGAPPLLQNVSPPPPPPLPFQRLLTLSNPCCRFSRLMAMATPPELGIIQAGPLAETASLRSVPHVFSFPLERTPFARPPHQSKFLREGVRGRGFFQKAPSPGSLFLLLIIIDSRLPHDTLEWRSSRRTLPPGATLNFPAVGYFGGGERGRRPFYGRAPPPNTSVTETRGFLWNLPDETSCVFAPGRWRESGFPACFTRSCGMCLRKR